jgi:hypothetical protein
MNQDITVSYRWTAEEMIKARHNHGREQCRPGYRVGLVFLACMAIVAGWAAYQKDGWSIPSVFFPLGGIYLLFFRKYDARWAIRRHFKKRPDKNTQIVWTLGDSELKMKTGDAESRQNWNQISKVRKAADGYLLYPNEALFYWIPVTAFSSEDERAKTEELLRSKVKDFADIK